MSAVVHPSRLAGPRNGGMAARRAVIRWASRLFRREWRQQLLVVTLLTVGVAAAIGSITIVDQTDAATLDPKFGSAQTQPGVGASDSNKPRAGRVSAPA